MPNKGIIVTLLVLVVFFIMHAAIAQEPDQTTQPPFRS